MCYLLPFLLVLFSKNIFAFTNYNFPNKRKLSILNSQKKKYTEPIPDIYKRKLMNDILLTSIYGSCGPLVYGYLSFFVPVTDSNSGDGIVAKDRNGDDVLTQNWLKNHAYPSRELVQGIKGDPYYLITTKNEDLEKYALNAICTHLGCVVPWNAAENKFMCPCHGSQYNSEGKVIRGPAPKSLALAKIEEKDSKIYLNQWNEIDFRDNSQPWWV